MTGETEGQAPPILSSRLVTSRLLIRPLEARDSQAHQRLANNPKVARFMARMPSPMTLVQAEAFFERKKGLAFSICLKDTSDFMGLIWLNQSLDKLSQSDGFGYWLGEKFWGQGYGKEILKAFVNHLFCDLGFQRLSAQVLPDNVASCKVLQSLGFARQGVSPCQRADGTAPEALDYVLTKAAFEHHHVKMGCALPIPDKELKVVSVAAVALIDADGRLLLAQRPAGKSMADLWEFPGGKIEPGETPEAALKRELREELGIETETSCLAPLTFASHSYPNFHLLMPLFACRAYEGHPQPREGQVLKWVAINQLKAYPMPAADLPLIPLIRDLLG